MPHSSVVAGPLRPRFTTLDPDGSVRNLEQEAHFSAFAVCGLCESDYCGCDRGKSADKFVDYVYVSTLPPPPTNASREHLLRRWASLVVCSPAMASTDAKQLLEVFIRRVQVAMDRNEATLNEMVNDYIKHIKGDELFDNWLYGMGFVLSPREDIPTVRVIDAASGAAKLGAECRIALAAFLSGDWGCITKLGLNLLQEAIVKSLFPDGHQSLSRFDYSAILLLEAVHVINHIMYHGFTPEGSRLAIEYYRRPVVPGMPDAPSARERDAVKLRADRRA